LAPNFYERLNIVISIRSEEAFKSLLGVIKMRIFYVLACAALCCLTTQVFAAGAISSGKQKSAVCAACHGMDGNSSNPEWPKLAGQNEKYLIKQLNDFKNQIRVSPLMSGPVANLSEQDISDLAAYFSSQTVKPGSTQPDKLALGQLVYRGGNLETGVAACTACHAPTGAGNPAAAYPMLSGQHSKYVEQQLRNFRDGLRKNDQTSIMRNIASRMTIEEIKAVSSYVAGLH
jgi:cytochrome c553